MTSIKAEERGALKMQLECAVGLLLEERGESAAIPEDAEAAWDLFRGLVNARPPMPASDELLAAQDALLQGMWELRGVTHLASIPPVPGHPGIRLWRGDITTLATDAIVNAANSQLLGCFVPGHHCIDNAIHTFAGIQLRLACARLMEAQGHPEPTGMAKVTDAFNLPSEHVIHTVGPIAQGHADEVDRALLADCYASCLDAAAHAGCASIAFCCISTGVFGFPQGEAAKVAVAAVEAWLAAHPRPMEVVFNVFTREDEALYRALLEPEDEEVHP